MFLANLKLGSAYSEEMAEKTKLREALEEKLENVAHKNNKLKQVYDVLLQHKLSSNKRSAEFWSNIEWRKNPDYIKSLVRTKLLTMQDTNHIDQTLLLNAAQNGSYKIAKLCLNMGANIEHTDKYNKSAMDLAKQYKWYHIEQLLLYHKHKHLFPSKKSKKELEQIANKISKQKGIIENIIYQLSKYDDITRNFFQDTLIDLMTNIFNDKLAFGMFCFLYKISVWYLQKKKKKIR